MILLTPSMFLVEFVLSKYISIRLALMFYRKNYYLTSDYSYL